MYLWDAQKWNEPAYENEPIPNKTTNDMKNKIYLFVVLLDIGSIY